MKPQKYKVGHEFPNQKRLTKNLGSHPKWRTTMWMWQCMSCGREYGPSLTNSITRPRKPACCFQTRKGDTNGNWKGYEGIYGSWIASAKNSALLRGISWEITEEDMWQQWLTQDGKCAYTGWSLTHGAAASAIKTASLDRIDSNKGYTSDNIQWVHKDINRFKNNYTEEKFLSMISAVAQNRGL